MRLRVAGKPTSNRVLPGEVTGPWKLRVAQIHEGWRQEEPHLVGGTSQLSVCRWALFPPEAAPIWLCPHHFLENNPPPIFHPREQVWSCLLALPDLGCYSVAKSYPTPCDPMDYCTPGSPILHHLPKFAQTHVHWVRGAIQLSHPLSPPFPPAFNLSQHQYLFRWVSSSLHQVAKELELQL